MLQVLAASALPLATKFAGVPLSEQANSEALAYIGLVALCLVVIRLLWAPYAMWRDQQGLVADLKQELTKPERLIIKNLARHRAKARISLASKLEDFQTLAFSAEVSEHFQNRFAEQMTVIRRLQAEAGLAESFDQARRALLMAVREEAATPNDEVPLARESARILKLLQRHLVGDLTADALALGLSKSDT